MNIRKFVSKWSRIYGETGLRGIEIEGGKIVYANEMFIHCKWERAGKDERYIITFIRRNGDKAEITGTIDAKLVEGVF